MEILMFWKTVGCLTGLTIVAATAFADVPVRNHVSAGMSHTPHAEQQADWGQLADAFSEEAHASAPSDFPPLVQRPGAENAPTVYGYWPYWGDDVSTVPVEHLTDLAIFGVELASDGSLTQTSRWTSVASEAVALAHPVGVKVHLVLICFDEDVMEDVLLSSSRRATTVAQAADLVNTYGADGVNVDFEGVPTSVRDELIAFVNELKAVVGEVTLATPAVDWNGAFDYDELAFASDGLFIMGYGYHWSGGDPGPIAPLYGGSPWGSYSLEWSVEDYREWGTPDDKIILGLPLYGRQWPSTSTDVPGTQTSDGWAVVYEDAVPAAESYGRQWDDVTHTPYAFPSSTEQLWYDDAESLADKMGYAVDQGLQGFGFWAVTYDGADAAFWDEVAALAPTTGGEEDTSDTGTAAGGDTAVDDTAAPCSESKPCGEEEGRSCGCGVLPASAGAVWLAGLFGVSLLRRRR